MTFIKKIIFFVLMICFATSISMANESNAEAFVLKLTNEAKVIQ